MDLRKSLDPMKNEPKMKIGGAGVPLAAALLLMVAMRVVGIEGSELLLPMLAGFVYDEDSLSGGVYYHHSGSSYSEPRGSPSWIKAIAKACGLDRDEIECCVSDCDNTADVGAHLTESRIQEILSLVGMGGTPVTPMCSGCHSTGPVEIDDTPCIYDTRTPIDILWGKPTLSNVRCANCDRFTIGPDEEGNFWCPKDEHFVNSDGDCVTDGCTSDGCYDDDDDDDDDDDGWW